MANKITYVPEGVCSTKIEIETEDGIIKNAKFTGGCNGNLKGICSLIKNTPASDVIKKLKGTKCGNKKTSCPDQLAKALGGS